MMDKLNGCSFLIEYDNLLEKYKTILDKVRAGIKTKFRSEPVYNNNLLKTNIKSHGNEVTDFCNKAIPKVDSNHEVISMVLLSKKITIIIWKCF